MNIHQMRNRITSLLGVIIGALMLGGCFDLKMTYDVKSADRVDVVVRLAIDEQALAKYNREKGTSGFPNCKPGKFDTGSIRIFKAGSDEVCELKITSQLEAFLNRLSQLPLKEGQEMKIEKTAPDTFRFTTSYDTSKMKEIRRQSASDPNIIYKLKEMFKNRAITHQFTAANILKTSGKLSNSGKTATVKFVFNELIDTNKDKVVEYVVFKTR